MNTPSASATPSTAQDKKPRLRSPSYPFVNLEQAVKLAEVVWEKEKRHPATIAVVAVHWDFGSKSSTGALSVAALKKFGLLDEEGSGGNRTVKLSDFAIDLIKNADVPEERAKLLKIAALKPDLHRTLWTSHKDASDASIRRFLVFDRKFNEGVVDSVIKEYRDTVAFAKLTESDIIPDTNNDSHAEPPPKSGNNVIPQTATTSKPNPAGAPYTLPQPPTPVMNTTLRYLPIPLDIGDAPIPVGMSDSDFDLLLDTLKLWKKKIVRPAQQYPNPARDIVFPRKAIWKNKDSDMPVVITDLAGERGGIRYYQSSTGTGIPEHELEFEK